MTLILIPAALAALWCFRSARTVALFGIAALILWACLSSSHAQMTAIVNCRAGAHAYTVDETFCPFILRAYDDLALGYRTHTVNLLKMCTEPMFEATGHGNLDAIGRICSTLNADALMALPARH